ncbi:MAG: PD40 domain-containing protein, partial [Bacteroidales bacterium]|nr:PD40 domain-containing protein [Bacteroidales bacterium]
MARLICLCITGSLIFSQEAISSAQGELDDSIMVRELLVMDTVGLEILGPSNDVAFYMNGLVFLSNTKYHHSMPPEHITFGQVTSYFVPLEYVALESSRPLFSNDPFPYDPAGTCYSRDFKTVYFTKKMEISGRRRPEKIFEMDIINGKATNYNQLSFTAGPTRFMHPAVSTDGEFMILASDLFPSNGGLDLFVVRKNESGWMTPVNLGGDINTSSHEWYPFLDQHNNLFFSSSGHLGFGGYDVYVCLFNENGWGKPQNLTDLVNTSKDELGFSIHPNRKMAVFSTNSEEEVLQEEVLKLGLNNSAFVIAGIDTENQDLSLLLKDLIRTGYTSAEFGAASDLEVEAGFSFTSLPLLSESEPEPEPEPEPE